MNALLCKLALAAVVLLPVMASAEPFGFPQAIRSYPGREMRPSSATGNHYENANGTSIPNPGGSSSSPSRSYPNTGRSPGSRAYYSAPSKPAPAPSSKCPGVNAKRQVDYQLNADLSAPLREVAYPDVQMEVLPLHIAGDLPEGALVSLDAGWEELPSNYKATLKNYAIDSGSGERYVFEQLNLKFRKIQAPVTATHIQTSWAKVRITLSNIKIYTPPFEPTLTLSGCSAEEEKGDEYFTFLRKLPLSFRVEASFAKNFQAGNECSAIKVVPTIGDPVVLDAGHPSAKIEGVHGPFHFESAPLCSSTRIPSSDVKTGEPDFTLKVSDVKF